MNMKFMKSLLAAALLAVSSAALTGCNEELAQPPMTIPSSDWKANTTIAELKGQYWQDENNYCNQVTANTDGEHVILGGRVIANDSTGNIYQNIVLQDATGAISISVALKDSYKKFKIGEEMFIDVTGLYAGKYAGLFQIGKEDSYNGTPQTGRLEEDVLKAHVELNGLPVPADVNILDMTIEEINAAKSVADLQKYQSQLVRINDVSFIGGGTETWAVQGSSGVNRYLIDSKGNRLLVRNSGMSSFNQEILPAGHGAVTGILSYFNGVWQFLFRTSTDCVGFGGESYAPVVEGKGTADEPYTSGSVLAGVSGSGVWVTGYIVGWVEGQVLSSGAHFTVPASASSNLLLAASPTETNVANCVPVQLPTGAVRNALNLQNNPSNLGKQVTLKGSLEAYFGASGIKSVTAYVWGDKGNDNQEPETPETPTGTATFKLVSAITSGHQYVMVVDGKIGKAIDSSVTFGRFTMEAVTITDNTLTTDVANAITITAVEGGYTMKDAYGRYLSMDDSHLSTFQLYTTQEAGSVWSITAESDGHMKIVNNLNTNCWVVRSGTYTNIAPNDVVKYPTYDMPLFYEKAN